MSDPYQVFDQLYQQGGWSGKGSGPGSSPVVCGDYLRFLQNFISLNTRLNIKTVLDIGCGDWQLMRCIDLKSVAYTGIDVSPVIIAANKARFKSPNIQFEVFNPVTEELPKADLVIVKDVLQHLPTADVLTLLWKIEKSCRVSLITNDFTDENGADVVVGGYRPVNILRSPFDASGVTVLSFGNKHTVLSVPCASS